MSLSKILWELFAPLGAHAVGSTEEVVIPGEGVKVVRTSGRTNTKQTRVQDLEQEIRELVRKAVEDATSKKEESADGA